MVGMKKMAAILAGLALSGAAQATLIDRGGGLIYDDVLKITWLSDANYAKTSGYSADGFMSWYDANAWAAGLSYGGYEDWRLPTAQNQDGSGPCYGANCTNSEMGHMFYNNLGGSGGNAGHSVLTWTNTANLALFTNLQTEYYSINNFYPAAYWSGTNGTNPNNAWVFNTSGYQYEVFKYHGSFAWAVRSDPAIYTNGPVAGCINDSALSGCFSGTGDIYKPNATVTLGSGTHPTTNDPKLTVSSNGIGQNAGSTLTIKKLDVLRGAVSVSNGGSLDIVGPGGAAIAPPLLAHVARVLVSAGGSLSVGGIMEIGTVGAAPAPDARGIVLGKDAGTHGQLFVTGAGSTATVNSLPSASQIIVGDAGRGELHVTNGARLEVRTTYSGSPGASGIDVRPIIVGKGSTSTGSLLNLDNASQLVAYAPGNFVNVYRGQAQLSGTVDLVMTGKNNAPLGLGQSSLPGVAQLPSNGGLVRVQFDGYSPKAGDLLPLINAGSIALGPKPSITPYITTKIGSSDAFEFSLGAGNTKFQIQQTSPGLYPALERMKIDGNDVLGIRFIDQALFLDWGSAPSARVSWYLDQKAGTWQKQLDSSGQYAIAQASLSDANKDAIVRELSTLMWGTAIASSGGGAAAKLGNTVPLPIFDSRKVNGAALTNALEVQFGAANQLFACGSVTCSLDLYGTAWNTAPAISKNLVIDVFNQRKDGQVLVFADDAWIGSSSSPNNRKWLAASTIAHEAGHGLGLFHTWGDTTEQAMDYVDSVRNDYFTDSPLQRREQPTATGTPWGSSQNAMYHLLKYTFGWSDKELAVFGGTPGDWDKGSWIIPTFKEKLAAVVQSTIKKIHNLVIQVPAFGDEGEQKWQTVVFIQDPTDDELNNVSFIGSQGDPFRVLASSSVGNTWDLYFEGSSGSEFSGVAGTPVVGGKIMKFDPTTNDLVVFGSYGTQSELISLPVPEPETYAMMLVGLGLIGWHLRRWGRHVGAGRLR